MSPSQSNRETAAPGGATHSSAPREAGERSGVTPDGVTLDRNAYRFHTDIRVRLSETDAVGIVFFGSFSTYMDVGRMDYLENLGLPTFEGTVRDLVPGAVVHKAASFHSPAHYNDVLQVHVRVVELGQSSYTFHFLMVDRKRPRVVATGALTLVWLDPDFKPARLPDSFRQAIAAFEGDNLIERS